MKRIRKKALLLAVSVALILTAAIGGTIAYIVTKTDSVTNTFEPAKVPIKVDETFEKGEKKDVKIQNTGNISAFIRAKIVVTWKNTDGNVSAIKPVENTDYTMTVGTTGWTYNNADGFWYCNTAVAPNGGNTPVLIISCKPETDKAPDGYDLSVEIIAESIQSEPASAVTEAWGVKIENGTVTKSGN